MKSLLSLVPPAGCVVALLLVIHCDWVVRPVYGRRGIFGVERPSAHQIRNLNHRHHLFEEYLVDLRGGRLSSGTNDNTDWTGDDPAQDTSEDPDEVLVPEEEAPVVSVKSHHHSNNGNSNKKSNAMGDPDGEGSSDDEDEDDEGLSDWDMLDGGDFVVDEGEPSDVGVMEHMHVAVEYVSEEQQQQQKDVEDCEETEEGGRSRTRGGVGIRLGQRFKNHRLHGNNKVSAQTATETMERHLLAAWQPYVFMPPSPEGDAYLREHARSIDGDGKTRLDRRTLYAGLLLEWNTIGGGHHSTRSSKTYRKFLGKDTSQALQAALSLATQPSWRKSFPRPSGIRLYNNEEDAVQGCTLAMQESIAMALVCI